jgi:hypothetical protein
MISKVSYRPCASGVTGTKKQPQKVNFGAVRGKLPIDEKQRRYFKGLLAKYNLEMPYKVSSFSQEHVILTGGNRIMDEEAQKHLDGSFIISEEEGRQMIQDFADGLELY